MLLALEAGIVLLGGASMGALRAAETFAYGMQGVGTVFHWYVTGRINRDDDVSVLFYREGNRYVVLNVPMVQVLWTAQRARRQQLWPPDMASAVVRQARRLHWTDRTWNTIGDSVGMPDLADHGIVRDPRSNIKALDSLKVLEEVTAALCKGSDHGF